MTNKLQEHWNFTYTKKPINQLGWYEENALPTLKLIKETMLSKNATILNIGVGTSKLIDDLLAEGYTNLIASDLSSVSLEILKKRIGNQKRKVVFIVDDLTNATTLSHLKNIDLWNDRAVLHFFTDKKDQKMYFNLLKKVVKPNGYVILAEFSLGGKKKCSGLDVFRYNIEMLQERLGDEFVLIKSFDYTFINPNGEKKPYIYTLFQRKNN